MKKDYSYPIDFEWTTDEVIDVVTFFEAIEKAYETGIQREKLMNLYKKFKKIVPSKAEEKKITNQFEEESGFSTYRVVEKARKMNDGELISM
ncbi:UPF0223 family protein [Bacillus carboniphilus]|uniref:UPF0223 protein LC087_03665 n=1 Tax=Bacillus carboniphilus TaxID=86663 RepID=A0ABY9JV66_9BACI|nr:UPF0223 family protein [Bacillus carboniphilus]WLR43299.1 UPF0223 family protein [Bacillus carboniphilus]